MPQPENFFGIKNIVSIIQLHYSFVALLLIRGQNDLMENLVAFKNCIFWGIFLGKIFCSIFDLSQQQISCFESDGSYLTHFSCIAGCCLSHLTADSVCRA
jgi:fucose permease